MPYRWRAVASLLGAALVAGAVWAQGRFPLPKLPPPDRFGTILMNRGCATAGVEPVVFVHWRHRARYSCRVCHYELEFALKTGATGITEEDNRHGLYCGACHDGKTAFSVTPKDNCGRCHAGKILSMKTAFRQFAKNLPTTPYGNRIDWVRANTILKPTYALYTKEKPIQFDKTLVLQAEWFGIPPAVFPHGVHEVFLDCGNCHPDIFNIKKKTTKHFEMRYILQGKFCGVCHLTVAFPLDDCQRCHPTMRQRERHGGNTTGIEASPDGVVCRTMAKGNGRRLQP